VKRGEVWWARVDDRRPVLVLHADDNEVRAIIIVPPAPTTIGVIEDVRLGAAEGLPTDGVVRVALPRPGFVPCQWLVTLSKDDVLDRAGALSAEKLGDVECLLRKAGLDAL
jgi:mRNA interferase MazF